VSARALSVAHLRRHLRDPLYRTSYLLVLSTGVSALLGFGFWTIAAHLYTAHEVGVNSSLIAAMSFIAGIAQLGLGGPLTRYVPTAGERARAFVLSSYAAVFACALVLAAAAALTSPLWSPTLGFVAHSALWALGFVFATVVWSLFALQDEVITGLGAAVVVPIENTAYAVVKLGLLILLSGIAPLAGPFIGWNAPGLVGVVLITWLMLSRLIPRHLARRPGAVSELPAPRQLVSTVGANYLGLMLLQVSSFLTPVMVTDVLGATHEAYFYAPWTILLALNAVTANTMASLTVEGALRPEEVLHLARRALLNTFALLAPVLVVILLGAPFILHLYGAAYAHAGTGLMRLLALSLVPSAVGSIGLGVARLQHDRRAVILIGVGPSLIQITLTLVLLHTVGLAGPGWAQLAADGAAALGLLATSLRPLLSRR
jgi:O-antigen/teichoic acid export membrane protein